MHRFPESTVTSAAVAIAALAAHQRSEVQSNECIALWQSLSTAAASEAEMPTPDWPKVKAMWLVADACSMMLRGDSVNAPFVPMMEFDEKRTAMPEDFTPDDAALLSDVAAAATSRALRARLSDLAWVTAKPKRLDDAHRAIDAYVEVQPTEDDHHTVLNDWRRAITLCLQLKKGADGRLEKIETALVAIAATAIPLDGTLGHATARTVFDHRMASDQGETFPDLLAARGKLLVDSGNCLWARAHLGLARDWYAKLGNVERAADMTLAMGLSWETEADQRVAADSSAGHLVANAFLEDAIQTLRQVPKSQRPTRNVDAHLDRLQQRLAESGRNAIKSMQRVSAGAIDITEIVLQSERSVAGKTSIAALLHLAHLPAGASVARMTENAKNSMREFPFSALFSAAHYGPDGRVIAKTPGGIGVDAEEQEEKLFATMMREYMLQVELTAKAQILPAAAVILREHTVRKVDLVQLMSQSPIVPMGRADQFAKGLWEGFEHDFATATYLLSPQIEHLVRWRLKEAGVSTTRLDGDGIENEVGLSSLIEGAEVKKIFGEDDAFELRALFCSALGPNLRNQVAHGLLSATECQTTAAVYAWWWVLRLTLRRFFHAFQQAASSNTPPTG